MQQQLPVRFLISKSKLSFLWKRRKCLSLLPFQNSVAFSIRTDDPSKARPVCGRAANGWLLWGAVRLLRLAVETPHIATPWSACRRQRGRKKSTLWIKVLQRWHPRMETSRPAWTKPTWFSPPQQFSRAFRANPSWFHLLGQTHSLPEPSNSTYIILFLPTRTT